MLRCRSAILLPLRAFANTVSPLSIYAGEYYAILKTVIKLCNIHVGGRTILISFESDRIIVW